MENLCISGGGMESFGMPRLDDCPELFVAKTPQTASEAVYTKEEAATYRGGSLSCILQTRFAVSIYFVTRTKILRQLFRAAVC